MKPFHIPFKSIEQYRGVVKEVDCLATYVGRDEEDRPIYDDRIKLPILTFTGTTKLHGTNAAVGRHIASGTTWFQSRTNIITPEADNNGFARWASTKTGLWDSLFNQLRADNQIFENDDLVLVIYGEWVGQGVNKGCDIHQRKKELYIFAAREWYSEQDNCYLSTERIASFDEECHNVCQFPISTWDIDIDFNHPDEYIPLLTRLTMEVEEQCPIARSFGIEGIGEGIVWTSSYLGHALMFKTKGEKHAINGPKQPITADPVLAKDVADFVQYAVTEARVQQAITETGAEDKTKLGDVLKWVAQDIIKEESDVLTASTLGWKAVQHEVTIATKNLFAELVK